MINATAVQRGRGLVGINPDSSGSGALPGGLP